MIPYLYNVFMHMNVLVAEIWHFINAGYNNNSSVDFGILLKQSGQADQYVVSALVLMSGDITVYIHVSLVRKQSFNVDI